MRIEKVEIRNFRLLENASVTFEPVTTVIVGRNNSGKTSLTEFFDRLMGEESGRFKVEDFSASTRPSFLAAKKLWDEKADPVKVLEKLPIISATLTASYDPKTQDLGPLSPFVIDLDPASHRAMMRIEYRPSLATLATLLEFPVVEDEADAPSKVFKNIKETIPHAYSLQLFAIDPTDPKNERALEVKLLTALLQYGFVGAQRALDQSKKGQPYVLGKLLEAFFQTASSTTAAAGDQSIAADLKIAVEAVEKQIHSGFDEKLKKLLPKFEKFGYPGLNDPDLRTETSLNVASLLSEHTKIFYTGAHGVHLPEGYNGLGTRNLIYILLQLLTFHKAYRARPLQPGIHLIFIEEPEAHLHPQMQEVFIKQLNDAVATFSKDYPEEPAWPVQFVVSTHSSHVANAAKFEAIRYFLTKPSPDGTTRQTQIKDFRQGLDQIPEKDRDFLHQYMTLTKCDLYFADKAIVIEGTTERLLMPKICQLVDTELDEKSKLIKQYITVVEAAGAHSKIFTPLLEFLEVKTLTITDIDVVKFNEEKKRWVKCPYSEGARTGNSTIKDWFDIPDGDQLTLEQLKAKTADQKTKAYRRIAYQVHEPGSAFCARSYEDAFILANAAHFKLEEDKDWGQQSWDIAQDMPKVETALHFAITEPKWNVPHYIKEGLTWLAEPIAEELPVVAAQLAAAKGAPAAEEVPAVKAVSAAMAKMKEAKNAGG